MPGISRLQEKLIVRAIAQERLALGDRCYRRACGQAAIRIAARAARDVDRASVGGGRESRPAIGVDTCA